MKLLLFNISTYYKNLKLLLLKAGIKNLLFQIVKFEITAKVKNISNRSDFKGGNKMEEKLYKQKEFADVAGISTATVVKMINTGELEKTLNGKIPESEIYKILEMRIKKFSSKGTLLLTMGDSKAQAEALKLYYLNEFFTDKKHTPTCVTSIKDLYFDASKKSSIISKNSYQERYNQKVLSLFMIKYKALAKDFVNSIFEEKLFTKEEDDHHIDIDFKGLQSLPGVVLRDFLLYDKVIYEHVDLPKEFIDEEIAKVQKSLDVCREKFNNKFINLMQKLKLMTGDNKRMFERDKITPKFFDCNDDLYKSFFYGLKDGKWVSDIIYLQPVEEINKDIINASSGRTIKTNMENMLKYGFYSEEMYKPTDSFEDMFKLSEKICRGYYSNLIINKTKEEFEATAPSNLLMAVSLACSANHLTIYWKSI